MKYEKIPTSARYSGCFAVFSNAMSGRGDGLYVAAAHASDAILYNSTGTAGLAIYHYREDICALGMLVAAHPDTCFRPVYEARCDSYQHRIDILERCVVARLPETLATRTCYRKGWFLAPHELVLPVLECGWRRACGTTLLDAQVSTKPTRS